MPTFARALVSLTAAALILHLIGGVVDSAGGVDIVTYHNDVARTGQNLGETTLTLASVTSTGFGKLGLYATDGPVHAQPLYLSNLAIPAQGAHNVLYIATEHDSLYAFDADTGATLWHVSLLNAGETPSDTRSCSQVTPEIGITSTPVIDRANGVIYVV